MGPGAPATTRRRAKSFLRNYYGIQQTDATAQDGVKSKTTEQTGHVAKSDPYDLDSHSFEVEKYMHKMFVEKQLPGIVQADNELVAEIRQLDGDMKTLVYENYSKFLSATDTINNMKSNVDNLESEMTRLTENIGKIATSSGAIHNSLGTKREKIRQLNGVHSLLTKLQFVFELPTNLHQCLEAGSYTQAVKSYCRTLSLLQHYKHLTVFTGIERECKAIMVQIAYKLRQKMCSEQATITEISECVGMLLALKEDPVALWKQYLDLATKCLDKINSTVLKNIEKLPLYIVPSEKSPKPAQTSDSASIKKTPIRKNSRPLSSVMNTPATPTDKELASTGSNTPAQQQAAQSQDKVSYMNTHFLRYVEGFVISFRSYFLSSAANINSHNVPADTDGMLSDQRPAGWIVKETRAHAGLTREQQTQAESAVKGVVSKITGGFLDTVASFLEYPDDIANMRPDVHVHVLQSLHLGTLANPGLCQMVRFDTLVTGLNQNWENRLIERALTVIKEGLLDRIREQDMSLGQKIHSAENTLSASMYEPSGPGSPHIMKDTIIWLKDVFKLETVTFLEKCLSSDAQFLDTKEGRKLFLKNIQTGFRMFWDQFLTEVK
ncbi:Vacuolar protein sorting-associated protein 51, partial [Lunasporangiospora selenospora]